MTPEQLRDRTTDSSHKRKQFDPKRALDQEILAALGLPSRAKDATMLHPGTMFRLFGPLWRRRATVDLVDSFTSFQPLGAPEPADPALGLPERYVAAKFYFSESFPDIEENRAFVVDMLRRVSAGRAGGPARHGRPHRRSHSDFRSAVGENVRVIDTSDSSADEPGPANGHHPRFARFHRHVRRLLLSRTVLRRALGVLLFAAQLRAASSRTGPSGVRQAAAGRVRRPRYPRDRPGDSANPTLGLTRSEPGRRPFGLLLCAVGI